MIENRKCLGIISIDWKPKAERKKRMHTHNDYGLCIDDAINLVLPQSCRFDFSRIGLNAIFFHQRHTDGKDFEFGPGNKNVGDMFVSQVFHRIERHHEKQRTKYWMPFSILKNINDKCKCFFFGYLCLVRSLIFSLFFIRTLSHSVYPHKYVEKQQQHKCTSKTKHERITSAFCRLNFIAPTVENLWKPDQRLTLSLSLLDSC